ncbi:hypothetical protein Hanom_Chr10g00931061 [Helianthus anomalus]
MANDVDCMLPLVKNIVSLSPIFFVYFFFTFALLGLFVTDVTEVSRHGILIVTFVYKDDVF